MASELGVQTIQHTNGTDALTVGSDGVVTAAQYVRQTAPIAFFAYRNSHQTGLATNQYHTVAFDATKFDTHSTINTTTGVFTAPVTGIYFFQHQLNPDMTSGTGDRFFSYFNVNNSTVRYQTNHTGTPYQNDRMAVNGSMVIDLTAGDTVQTDIWFAGSGTTFQINGYDATGYFTYLSGYLIG